MAYLLDIGGHQLYDVANFRLHDAESLMLVTDRTAADVQRVLDLISRPMTPAEKTEWSEGMKGAYNYVDFNRVEYAVVVIAERLKQVGWNVYPTAKIDWSVSDFPTVKEMRRYLDNIRILRSTLPTGLPNVPVDMDAFSYIEANTIELILEMIDAAITNILDNAIYSVEIFSGEV